MSNTKYELTDETIEFDGVTLHRIRAFILGSYKQPCSDEKIEKE